MNERTLRRVVRQADLHLYVGLKRTQIAEMVKAGEFPKPMMLSDTGRGKVWLESEVLAWQDARLAKRNIKKEKA